jgi:FkbM family methyltransferase
MAISVQDNPELFWDLQGWTAPSKDKKTYAVSLREVSFLGASIKYCTGLRTVVQAGGNIGVFAKVLSDVFQTVYTVEPDELNFLALQHNVSSCSNVIAYRAAFGYERSKGQLYDPQPGNASAYQVELGNDFDVVRVDDLQITDCDLLLLDVEGYEYFAVQGALQTILASSPVICLEMRSAHFRKYGLSPLDLHALMQKIGYVQRQVIERRDHIFTRKSG